jgi:hypothetical protein
MRSIFKENSKTIVVAMVTAVVTALGAAMVFNVAPAIAHGVKHAKYAHNADKVDGMHANQLRSIAKGRSFSYRDGPYPTVGATPTALLRVQLKAPRRGVAEVSYAHTDFVGGTAQTIRSWVELDPTSACSDATRINGTEMFNTMAVNEYGNSAATAIVPVAKGNHTLVLCAEAEAAGTEVGVASLSGTFVPAGQVSIAVPPAPRSGSGSRFGR